MDKLFLTILNMSLTGAFVIAAICLARIPLKKAPKIISYCLWAVAWFRLMIPFSFESVISLIPFKSAPIPPDIAMQAVPRIDSGIPAINNIVSEVLPAAIPAASANPLQIWTMIGAYIWVVGILVMLLYGVTSYVRLKVKMRSAILIEDNIYETDRIKSPFVLGVIKPRIYLPFDLSDQERDYIILHEQTHIQRYDHISKVVAYFLLCAHWFNPLVWAAFILMGADMEMACDERVLKDIGVETKRDYSLSLLSLAANKRLIGGSPLAFSEGGLKTRIMNVLKYKKSSLGICIVAVVLTVALSVGLALNRSDNSTGDSDDSIKDDAPPVIREAIPAELFAQIKAYEDLHTESNNKVGLHEDVQGIIRSSEYIRESIIVLNFVEDSENKEVEISVSIELTLERKDQVLPYSQALWIAEIIRDSIPDIKDENISISVGELHIYPAGEKDEDIID